MGGVGEVGRQKAEEKAGDRRWSLNAADINQVNSVISHDLQYTNHRLEVTRYQSQVTSHQSPANYCYKSPLLLYRLLVDNPVANAFVDWSSAF